MNQTFWLSLQKDYIVLSVVIHENRSLYLLNSDNSNGSPSLHNANQFQIISHKIPKNWMIHPGHLEICNLGPKEWWEDDFWEACYDNDPKGLEIYRREAKIIYESEGLEF